MLKRCVVAMIFALAGLASTVAASEKKQPCYIDGLRSFIADPTNSFVWNFWPEKHCSQRTVIYTFYSNEVFVLLVLADKPSGTGTLGIPVHFSPALTTADVPRPAKLDEDYQTQKDNYWIYTRAFQHTEAVATLLAALLDIVEPWTKTVSISADFIALRGESIGPLSETRHVILARRGDVIGTRVDAAHALLRWPLSNSDAAVLSTWLKNSPPASVEVIGLRMGELAYINGTILVRGNDRLPLRSEAEFRDVLEQADAVLALTSSGVDVAIAYRTLRFSLVTDEATSPAIDLAGNGLVQSPEVYLLH